MNLRKILCLLPFIFTISSVFAQSDCPKEPQAPTAEQTAEMRRNAKDCGFLWKLTKNGKVSHLYGTIHLSKVDWRVPGSTVMQAIRQSNSFAIELNIYDPATQKEMAAQSATAKGIELSTALKERVARLTPSNCLKPNEWEQLSSEMKVAYLDGLTLLKEGIHPSLGVEAVLTTIASRMQKPVIAIETWQEQLKALTPVSSTQALASFEKTLTALEAKTNQLLTFKTLKAWAESDFETLSAYADWCQCMNNDDDRLLMKKTLDDRNFVMAERIDKLNTENRSVFSAIGSLHMIGENGLPKLLEKSGYKVERVF